MKVFFTSFLLALLFSLSLSAQTPKPTASQTPKPAEKDEDVVKISTNLIQVDVTVTDKSGKIVTDLKPEDFEVYENNQKQDITNFSFVTTAPQSQPAVTPKPPKNAPNSVPLPPPTAIKPEQVRRTIALVVDDLTLSFESTYYVRRALKKFVDEQMQEGDLVAIVRTAGGIGALQQFTSDKRQLYAAIEKVRWYPMGNGKIGAFAQMEATPLQRSQAAGDSTITDESLERERNQIQSFSDFQGSIFATGTLGALNYIIRGMQELPGRKSIMLMSEGFKLVVKDEWGFSDGSRILESLRRLVDQANRASVVIYTMDARGLQTLGLTAADNTSGMTFEQVEQSLADRKNELFDTQSGLTYLAQQTGGIALINNNDLSGGIRKMIADQNGYYLLGYAPDEETFDPKTRRFNKLNIKIKRPGLKVRYRSGFFGVSDETIADGSQKPSALTPRQQINNALTSPFAVNDIELRLNTLFGNTPKDGSYARALIHVNAKDLKFTNEPDGTHKAVFDVLAVIFGDSGGIVDQLGKSYTLTLNDKNYDAFLREGFVYNLVFPVKKPGAYQFRVALRDSGSSKVGSANQFIEVPNLKKGWLTISGIVLENMTLQEFQASQSNAAVTDNKAAATASRGNPQGDTSLRRFKRGTVLRYGFEIYNPKLDASQKIQVTTHARVFRDGKLIFESKPILAQVFKQGERSAAGVVGAISLGGGMEPGDYILQIVATDPLAKEKRQITTQFVQFEIVE